MTRTNSVVDWLTSADKTGRGTRQPSLGLEVS
jgi:hypothetical protein